MTNSVVVDFLARAKKQYDQGDKTQILDCLDWCLFWYEPIPPWLKQAFRNAYYAKSECKIKSWDEVFGRPFKKGTRPARELYKRRIARSLYDRVEERHSAGEPIDKSLFEAVGKDFGVGGTVAAELYYQIKEDEAILSEGLKKTRKTSGKF